MLGDLLGRARGDDLAAALAALGAQVDHPVGAGDDVEVVLDDDDRVAGVAQPEERVGQQLDVREVQAGRRLVEHVERAPGGLARELARELHALRFAAGERRRGLAELDVAEADLAQRGEPLADARDRLEQLGRPRRR